MTVPDDQFCQAVVGRYQTADVICQQPKDFWVHYPNLGASHEFVPPPCGSRAEAPR